MSAREPNSPQYPRVVRFGPFEYDLTGLQLTRKGSSLKLQQQPAMLLARLILHAGQIVTREELKEAIWPSGTYVEFDFGLNTAVNRLRRVLRDSASDPAYIETVPKQGYRFIAPIELVLPPPSPGLELVPDSRPCEPAAEPAAPAAPKPALRTISRTKLTAAAAALLLIAGAAATFLILATTGNRESPASVHSFLSLPAGQIPEVVVISPAGDQIVYQALEDGSRRLYRRYLNEETAHIVPDSQGGTQPFFSPDGKQLGFFALGGIRITDEHGTRELIAMQREFAILKAIWAADGFVYYTTPVNGIWRIAVAGGKPEPVLKPPPGPKSPPLYFPQQVLAGNPPALLFSANNGPVQRWVAWAAVGAESQPLVLINRAMGGEVRCGYLLSWWQGKLRAAPFDERHRRLSGSLVDALPNVGNNGWRGPIASMSENGTLVFIEDYVTRKQLHWIDRTGKDTPLPAPPALYEQAEASPDGTKVCIARCDRPGLWSLWILDLRTGAWTPMLTMETPRPRAVWSPDGKEIVAAMVTGEDQFVNLYRIPVDQQRPPERLTYEADYGQFPGSWSAARNAILFTEGVHSGTQSDIHVLALAGDRRTRALVATPGVERCPAFSRDGQLFAYSSNAGTGDQVFVRSYDPPSPPRQVSPAGGVCPAWSSDGKSLYYLDSARALIEVPYLGHESFGPPRQLFPPGFTELDDWWTRGYSVASGGRFLVIRKAPGEKPPPPQIHIITNWITELKRLAPRT